MVDCRKRLDKEVSYCKKTAEKMLKQAASKKDTKKAIALVTKQV